MARERKEVTSSLPVWTVEQYQKEKETKDLCLESCWGDKLFNKPTDYCNDMDYTEDNDVSYLYETSKKVKVFTKRPFKINSAWLKEQCKSYAKQWGMAQWDVEPECLEMFDKFTKEFNKKQYWYTEDTQIAWLDMSKAVKEELCKREQIYTENAWQEALSK